MLARTHLSVASCISAPLLLSAFLSAEVPQSASKIYFGGPIITVGDKNPSAEAVAVSNGKIVAVGKRDDV